MDVSESIQALVEAVTDEVAADIEARYRDMVENFRSETNVTLRGVISDLKNLKDNASIEWPLTDEEEGEDGESDVEEVVDTLVEYRADLLDLQDAVEENVIRWKRDSRDKILDDIVKRIAQGRLLAEEKDKKLLTG